MSRVAIMFGQFGAAADPINLPAFRDRLANAKKGIATILVQHTDSQKVYDFLSGYFGPRIIVGASLGAMSAVVCAGYLKPKQVTFVGGFQPSDWDPSGHDVRLEGPDGDVITRAITVPDNVQNAMCFRNPIVAATGALGHATYIAADPAKTRLEVIPRNDPHPGDFGEAAGMMFEKIMELIK